MKIKSIAPWFGGKRTLAPAIVQQLGPHTQYFEPFCGSMAVLLAKEPSQKETVNDLHGDLINLARVLQVPAVAETLYERLQSVLFSEDLLEQARKILSEPFGPEFGDSMDLERSYWYFLASWMMREGIAGTNLGETNGAGWALCVRWTKGGGSSTVAFRSAVDSIPAWHRRLQNVVILHRDAFRILDRFEDDRQTAIYADPPYPAESRSGFKGSGANARYLHEFSHAPEPLYGGGDDHVRLRDALAAYQRARVVVSSYDCPRIRELYAGWTFIDQARQKHLAAPAGRGARKKVAPEVLIVNGPEYP